MMSKCVHIFLQFIVKTLWSFPPIFVLVFTFSCYNIVNTALLLSACFPNTLKILYFPIVPNRYTAHCLALVSHMTDNQKTIFLRKVLTSDEILHMKIKYVPLFFLSLSIVFIHILYLEPSSYSGGSSQCMISTFLLPWNWYSTKRHCLHTLGCS